MPAENDVRDVPANGELENGDPRRRSIFLCRVAHLRAARIRSPVSSGMATVSIVKAASGNDELLRSAPG